AVAYRAVDSLFATILDEVGFDFSADRVGVVTLEALSNLGDWSIVLKKFSNSDRAFTQQRFVGILMTIGLPSCQFISQTSLGTALESCFSVAVTSAARRSCIEVFLERFLALAIAKVCNLRGCHCLCLAQCVRGCEPNGCGNPAREK